MSQIPALGVPVLAALLLAGSAGSTPRGLSDPPFAPPRLNPPLVGPPLLRPPLELPPPPQLVPLPPLQSPPGPFPGQAGKDVIWLPTPEALVERMLAMAQVGPRDLVYDLGSGDGRLVIAAARRGARAVGVEFNPELIALSERRARAEGVAGKARFVQGDIFETDFSEATAVTLYLLPSLNMRLRPTLLRMRPGTRVVSHAFGMEDWAPDESSRAEGRTAHLWFVPAGVEGSWCVTLQGGRSFDVAFAQRFQRLEGRVALGPAEAGLREPALRGDAIRFGFVDQDGIWYELAGTVSGDGMSGRYEAAGRRGSWTAVRVLSQQCDTSTLGVKPMRTASSSGGKRRPGIAAIGFSLQRLPLER